MTFYCVDDAHPCVTQCDACKGGPEAQQGAATPGPWVVEREGWRHQRVYGKDARVPAESRFIAEVSLDYDGAEANAMLIAASPTLLAACQKALEWAEANMQRAGILDVAGLRAAVLLATEGRVATQEIGKSYVAQVPYHCDRIVWRGLYYHLDSLLPKNEKKSASP